MEPVVGLLFVFEELRIFSKQKNTFCIQSLALGIFLLQCLIYTAENFQYTCQSYCAAYLFIHSVDMYCFSVSGIL